MTAAQRRHRPPIVVSAIGVVAALCLGGCAKDGGTSRRVSHVRPAVRQSVTTEKRTIVSAVDLKGVIDRWPEAPVVVPAAGELVLSSVAPPGPVTAGQVLARIEVPCEEPPASESAVAAPTDPADLTAGAPAAAPAPMCRPTTFDVKAPSAGDLSPAPAVVAAVDRGLRRLPVTEEDPLGSVRRPGYRIVLPLGEDDQPAMFVKPPMRGLALLTGVNEPVFDATFVAVDYTADAGTSTVIAEAIEPPAVIPGSKVTVSFVLSQRADVDALPTSAIRVQGNVGQVLVVAADGATTRRDVIAGPTDGAWREVAGLAPGEKVIRYPLESELAGP